MFFDEQYFFHLHPKNPLTEKNVSGVDPNSNISNRTAAANACNVISVTRSKKWVKSPSSSENKRLSGCLGQIWGSNGPLNETFFLDFGLSCCLYVEHALASTNLDIGLKQTEINKMMSCRQQHDIYSF